MVKKPITVGDLLDFIANLGVDDSLPVYISTVKMGESVPRAKVRAVNGKDALIIVGFLVPQDPSLKDEPFPVQVWMSTIAANGTVIRRRP